VDTLYCDGICLKFKLVCIITTGCFQSLPLFFWQTAYFRQDERVLVTQGSAVTFFMCGGQIYTLLCNKTSQFIFTSAEKDNNVTVVGFLSVCLSVSNSAQKLSNGFARNFQEGLQWINEQLMIIKF